MDWMTGGGESLHPPPQKIRKLLSFVVGAGGGSGHETTIIGLKLPVLKYHSWILVFIMEL